jgi:hypothetical protein
MRAFGKPPSTRRRPTQPEGWVREFRDCLDSSQAGLAFSASFRVEWRRTNEEPPERFTADIACRLVRVLAEPVALGQSVLRPEATAQDINHQLRHRLPLQADGVEVTWAHVSLSVDEATRTTAQRITQARQELELDALARRQVLARVNFMYDEILRTPASARIYLLLEHHVRVGALPPDLDVDRVIREVQQWHPESKWVVTAQLLHAFIAKLTAADADDLLGTLRSLFLDYGEKELAEQLPTQATEAAG